MVGVRSLCALQIAELDSSAEVGPDCLPHVPCCLPALVPRQSCPPRLVRWDALTLGDWDVQVNQGSSQLILQSGAMCVGHFLLAFPSDPRLNNNAMQTQGAGSMDRCRTQF